MSERRDIAEDLVDIALKMRVGKEAPRDLTDAVLKRHRESQQGEQDMNLPEIVSPVNPFGGDRAWNWTLSAAAVLALMSVGWLFFGVERSELPTDAPKAGSEHQSVTPEEVWRIEDIERLELDTTAVVARGHSIDDDGLQRLCARLPSLTLLTLHDTDVTDAGLLELRSLRSLTTLMLDHSRRLTDKGLETVATLKQLRRLSVAGWVGQTMAGPEGQVAGYVDPYSKYTNDGLTRLARLQRLRSLDLRGTNIGDEALIYILKNGSKDLAALELGFTGVTDRSLRVMAEQDRIVELDMSSAGKLMEDDSLEVVSNIESLRFLAIGGNNMRPSRYTAAGVMHLGRLPLVSLTIESNPNLDRTNGWSAVARVRSLRRLAVRHCRDFDDSNLAILCRDLPRLRSLELGPSRALDHDNVVEIITGSTITELNAPILLGEVRLRQLWQDVPRLTTVRLPDGTDLTR